MDLPHITKSQRKRPLEPFKPFSRSKLPQRSVNKADGGYPRTTRYKPKLSINKEVNTLDNMWGSLFDEDG